MVRGSPPSFRPAGPDTAIAAPAAAKRSPSPAPADSTTTSPPQARSRSTTPLTSACGAEAPAVTPILACPPPTPSGFRRPHRQVCRYTLFLRDLAQPVGVGTVGGTHHQKDIASSGQRLDGILPVLGGIADIILARTLDRGKAFPQRSITHAVSSTDRVVWVTKARLSGSHDRKLHDVLRRLHQIHGAALRGVVLAHGTLHLWMALVPDQDAFASFPRVATDLQMHLGHQRAGRIEHA